MLISIKEMLQSYSKTKTGVAYTPFTKPTFRFPAFNLQLQKSAQGRNWNTDLDQLHKTTPCLTLTETGRGQQTVVTNNPCYSRPLVSLWPQYYYQISSAFSTKSFLSYLPFMQELEAIPLHFIHAKVLYADPNCNCVTQTSSRNSINNMASFCTLQIVIKQVLMFQCYKSKYKYDNKQISNLRFHLYLTLFSCTPTTFF